MVLLPVKFEVNLRAKLFHSLLKSSQLLLQYLLLAFRTFILPLLAIDQNRNKLRVILSFLLEISLQRFDHRRNRLDQLCVRIYHVRHLIVLLLELIVFSSHFCELLWCDLRFTFVLQDISFGFGTHHLPFFQRSVLLQRVRNLRFKLWVFLLQIIDLLIGLLPQAVDLAMEVGTHFVVLGKSKRVYMVIKSPESDAIWFSNKSDVLIRALCHSKALHELLDRFDHTSPMIFNMLFLHSPHDVLRFQVLTRQVFRNTAKDLH